MRNRELLGLHRFLTVCWLPLVALHLLGVTLDSVSRNTAVDLEWVGNPNCMSFRPDGLKLEDGKSYWVEIDGLKRIDGAPAKIRFIVLFVELTIARQ